MVGRERFIRIIVSGVGAFCPAFPIILALLSPHNEDEAVLLYLRIFTRFLSDFLARTE